MFCHRLTTEGPQPCGRSWHSLSPVNKDQLLLFGGFSQDEKTLGKSWKNVCVHDTPSTMGPKNTGVLKISIFEKANDINGVQTKS